MFTCHDCDGIIDDGKKFIKHILFFHKNQKSYACGMLSCPRVFSSIDSLRKHLKMKHSLANNQNTARSRPKKQKKKQNNTVCDVPLCDELESTPRTSQNDETNISNILPDNSENIITYGIDNQDLVLFAAELFSFSDIPRCRAINIIKSTSNVIETILGRVQNRVLMSIKESNSQIQLETNIQKIFHETQLKTSSITEWNLLNLFKSLGTFIEPTEYLLGEIPEFRKKNNTRRLVMKEVFAQFIPIRNVLKNFFELPNIFEETKNYLRTLEHDDIISNFVQGNLWRKLREDFGDKFVLPINLFFDDFENNNPLGSHKGISKCGAVYLSISCLPPAIASKLDSIFLLALFNSLDRKMFSNAIIFSRVIDELKELETNGIEISVRNSNVKIYFKLALFLGDNLGIHEALGFITSFKSAAFCRFCKIKSSEIQHTFFEDPNLMRNKTNYSADLQKHECKSTGIVELCVFHQLQDFHVTQNVSVDVLHDILEGICQYDLGQILYTLIKTKKCLKLTELNLLTKGFEYGPNKNMPPEILLTHIMRKRLSMTGAEMFTFIRHIPLILAHVVSEADDTWELILLLQKIVEICMAKNLSKNTHTIFRQLVGDYLQMLTTIFPGCLKPKHHFLTHYPTVFQVSGPFSNMSSIRYESKHRLAKMTSKTSLNRTNVCRTIAIKDQLRLNFQFMKPDNSKLRIYDPISIKSILNLDVPELDKFVNLLPTSLQKNVEFETIKYLNINGSEISVHDIVMVPSEEGPIFYKIDLIIMYEQDPVIVVKWFDDIFYEIKFNAYEIISERYEHKILDLDELYSAVVTHSVEIYNGCKLIVKNWV